MHVWPDAFVQGWPDHDDAPDLPVLPLTEAIAKAIDGRLQGNKPHASAAVAVVEGFAQPGPRLNQGAPPEFRRLVKEGEIPHEEQPIIECWAFFVDFDLHDKDEEGNALPKRPWREGEAEDLLGAVRAAAVPGHPLHGAHLYSTKHGWRAVVELSRSVPPELYLGAARAFNEAVSVALSALPPRTGLEPDAACHPTFNRGYALPLPGAVYLPGSGASDPTPYVQQASRSVFRFRRRTSFDADRPEPDRPLRERARLGGGSRGPSSGDLLLLRYLSERWVQQGWASSWQQVSRGHIAWEAGEGNATMYKFAAFTAEALCDLVLASAQNPFGGEPGELCEDTLAVVAQETYLLVEPSLRAAVEEGVNTTPLEDSRTELWRMVTRCVEREPSRERRYTYDTETERRYREAQERARARMARLLARKAQPATQGAEAPPQQGTPPSSPPTPSSGVIGLLPPAPEDAPHLVDHNGTYFVRDARRTPEDPRCGDEAPLRFFAPTSSGNAATLLLERGTADLSEPTYVRSSPSGGALRKWRDISVDPKTAVVSEVVVDYRINHAEVSADVPGVKRRLSLPGAPLTPVEPKYDPEIEEWLDALAGDDPLGLRAWLALVHRMDKPLCAAYFRGPGSAGKGLFLSLLQTLWAPPRGDGPGIMPFGEVLGQFNAQLEQSPIVYINEAIKLPSGLRLRPTEISARFRDFVGETKHRVEAKNQTQRMVYGCPRMVITANDDNALPLDGGESGHSIEATIMRIRYFPVSDDAVRLLKARGGFEGCKPWLEGRGFARHVAWLRQQAELGAFDDVPGVNHDRFLVAGVPRGYHERMVLSGLRLDMLEAIALALLSGPRKAAENGVWPREDGVAVAHTLLSKGWTNITSNHKPKSQTLRVTLEALEGSKAVRHRHNGTSYRCWLIPKALIRRGARAASVGSDEALEKAMMTVVQTPEADTA